MPRSHLVLVPGFGGFDALGQMHYYTRVVAAAPPELALHFFDNLPTAGVATRGQDLLAFVDKLVARHVIGNGDRLTLLGHSTGGLDIRWALEHWGTRRPIDRFVFMSVPHRGTNIADFVDAQARLVGLLRFGLKHAPWVAARVIDFVKWRGDLDDSELVTLAIDDVKAELREPDDAWLAACARRAASELALWRIEMASDFAAIADLKTDAFSCAMPPAEHCLSFATVAPSPFAQPMHEDFAVRDLDTVLALAHDDAIDRGKTDSVFRLAYAACSAGPFRHRATIPWLPELALGAARAVEAWDNDGIVNTASMVCGETYLVPGDHADVIGHYQKLDQAYPTGRKHEAYDLLRSAAGFADTTFAHIWRRVFAFALAR